MKQTIRFIDHYTTSVGGEEVYFSPGEIVEVTLAANADQLSATKVFPWDIKSGKHAGKRVEIPLTAFTWTTVAANPYPCGSVEAPCFTSWQKRSPRASYDDAQHEGHIRLCTNSDYRGIRATFFLRDFEKRSVSVKLSPVATRELYELLKATFEGRENVRPVEL